MGNLYRKKPVVIEAVRVTAADYNPALIGTEHSPFDGCPFSDMPDWLFEAVKEGRLKAHTRGGSDYAQWDIVTLEGTMSASPGDWIIKGIAGELYPCQHDIFTATYEPAIVLTEADALADMNGTPRPDNPSVTN